MPDASLLKAQHSMENPIIQITCSNCGKVLKVKRPSKPGKYSVPCSGCQTKLGFIIKEANPAQNMSAAGMQAPPGPQAPNNSMMPERKSKGDFVQNAPCQVACAFDCGYIHQITPVESGTNRFICPRCKGRTSFEVRGKTLIISRGDFESYQPFRGKLILIRKGWFNKEFRLSQGSNIIGRYDADPRGNSDIAISDDPLMSRRSIDISMEHHELKGFKFRLKVLRATNPVLVNNNPLVVGEDFSLNFNDSIILGKTQFRFVKDV